MMMMETAQREQVQDVSRDVEIMNGLMKDNGQGMIRQQEFTMNRQIHRQEAKGDSQWARRLMDGPVSRRRSQRISYDESFRAPSLFTWRY